MANEDRDDKVLEALAKDATADFYILLGVTFDSDATEIKRQYRKTSVKYHPDRNPEKGAADKFILLGQARDILIDPKLKSIYDTTRLRRKEKELQNQLLDSRRRKLKEDLERGERNAANAQVGAKRKRDEELSEAERREREIERLAEDGKRRRREHQEKLQRQREEEEASFMAEKSPEVESRAPLPGETSEIDRTIKARFSRDGEATSWDKEKITSMFTKYGKVDSVVLGKDKKIRLSGEKHKKVTATVFIVYTRIDHAHAAVLDAKADYPALESVSWVSKEPDMKSPIDAAPASAPSTPKSTPKTFRASFGASFKGLGGTPNTPFSPKTPSLEEITMMRLKAAEKKRLEEQIRAQEAAEEAGSAV